MTVAKTTKTRAKKALAIPMQMIILLLAYLDICLKELIL